METHYRKLENMYLSAPVNREIYPEITIRISDKKSELTLPISEKYFHAAQSLHGSVYFKMLDDAAYFAVQSILDDFFIYTVSMETDFLRPINGGIIKAVGTFTERDENDFWGEALLLDEQQKKVARAKGKFMKSKILLNEMNSYAL